jgi:hypothetical protein
MILESKYKLGDIVSEKTRPSQKMVIERHADGIYYCRLIEAPNRKALVYLERDLMTDKPKLMRALAPSQWVRAPFQKRMNIEQLKIKTK